MSISFTKLDLRNTLSLPDSSRLLCSELLVSAGILCVLLESIVSEHL